MKRRTFLIDVAIVAGTTSSLPFNILLAAQTRRKANERVAVSYKPDGSPAHWVGVHPNGGYYAIDVDGIVAAFERGLVFTKEDIQRLVATNRGFMWNQQIQGARFQRIDGGEPDARWKNYYGRC